MAAKLKRRLNQRTPAEVAQRNVHQLGKPAEQRWNELAKGHQVVLVIAVRRRHAGLPAKHRVGIAAFHAAHGYANQGSLFTLGVALRDGFQVAEWQLPRQQGNGGFRRYHQLRFGTLQLLAIPLQRHRHAAAGLELFVLRNETLQQRQRERRGSGGCRLGQCQSALALGMQCQQRGQHGCHQRPGAQVAPVALPHLRQQHGQHCRHKAQAVNTNAARQRRQRPIDMRITARAPWKAGPPDAPRQFGQQPECSENNSC